MIPSRGCAYICMVRRIDAYRAYLRIKKTNKLLGHPVKVSFRFCMPKLCTTIYLWLNTLY